jgi:DNA-binding MarR family transcriptional regulator
MREEGIGRPSTYAPTVEKLLERTYVEEDGSELVPTEKGRTLWTRVVPYYGPVAEDESLPDRLPDGVELDDLEIDVFYPDFTAEMEETLDEIEEGEQPAAAVWESFRDQFRGMHNVALKRRRERPTPSQLALAESLMRGLDEEARAEVLREAGAEELEGLSGGEISELIDRLQEENPGSGPPASEKQLAFIETLAEEQGLDESEAAGLVDATDFSELTGGRDGTASALIEELRERRPASEKQLEFIEDLAEEAGLDESEACALVGAERYAELTGGQEGTASRLIETLKERNREAE